MCQMAAMPMAKQQVDNCGVANGRLGLCAGCCVALTNINCFYF